MESIMVHGPAFEACTAMRQLEMAGVDLVKVTHMAPVAQQPALSVLLGEAADLAGIALPEALQVMLPPSQAHVAQCNNTCTYTLCIPYLTLANNHHYNFQHSPSTQSCRPAASRTIGC